MPGICVVGAQWGDEAKARIIDVQAADAVYLANADTPAVIDAVRKLLPEGAADAVFEAAGSPETYNQAVHLAAPGATYCQVGIASDPVAIDWHTARWKELTIKVSLRMCHDFSRAIALAAARRLNLDALVTHTFPLEDLPEAFDLVAGYRDGVIRAVIQP